MREVAYTRQATSSPAPLQGEIIHASEAPYLLGLIHAYAFEEDGRDVAAHAAP